MEGHKNMATTNVPEGYRSTRDRELYPIKTFEAEGDQIEGKFLGIKKLPSKFNKGESILWKIAEKETGEIILINEKTTMLDVRIEDLKENDDVIVIFHGIKQGKNRKYKDFEVLIRENDFQD
jgi:hypothetical protein